MNEYSRRTFPPKQTSAREGRTRTATVRGTIFVALNSIGTDLASMEPNEKNPDCKTARYSKSFGTDLASDKKDFDFLLFLCFYCTVETTYICCIADSEYSHLLQIHTVWVKGGSTSDTNICTHHLLTYR